MANVTDKITDTRNAARPASTTVSSSRSVGGGTLACASLTGWPTASKVHFVTYQIDSNSNPIAGTQLDCYGIVSGSNIGSFTVVDGTDNGNSIGDVVQMLPTAAWGQDLADALTSQHSRAGAHVSITNTGGLTTDTLTVTSGSTLPAGDIGTADIANNAVDYTKVATGAVVQVVNALTTAFAVGTTTIPLDDTIPQNTEGDQYMSLAITPKSTTNKLVITANIVASNSSNSLHLIGALFQDSTANALAANALFQATGTGMAPIVLTHTMAAGTTSATTFKVRVGGSAAGTTTFNGTAGAELFGAITKSSIVITEYKA